MIDLELGAYYINGLEHIRGPMVVTDYGVRIESHPFKCKASCETFRPNGVYGVGSSAFDLVERVYPISESDYALLLQAKLDEELFKKAAENMDKLNQLLNTKKDGK